MRGKMRKKCISEARDIKIAVGSDNRNRTGLVPLGTETGRNSPSGNRFLFSCSKWFRFLVRPEEGWALANLDFRAQEIQVGAALSGDHARRARPVHAGALTSAGHCGGRRRHEDTLRPDSPVRAPCTVLDGGRPYRK